MDVEKVDYGTFYDSFIDMIVLYYDMIDEYKRVASFTFDNFWLEHIVITAKVSPYFHDFLGDIWSFDAEVNDYSVPESYGDSWVYVDDGDAGLDVKAFEALVVEKFFSRIDYFLGFNAPLRDVCNELF